MISWFSDQEVAVQVSIVALCITLIGWFVGPLAKELIARWLSRVKWQWLQPPVLGTNHLVAATLSKRGTEPAEILSRDVVEHQHWFYRLMYRVWHRDGGLGSGGIPVSTAGHVAPVKGGTTLKQNEAHSILIKVEKEAILPVPWKPWKSDAERSPRRRRLRLVVAVTQGKTSTLRERIQRTKLAIDPDV